MLDQALIQNSMFRAEMERFIEALEIFLQAYTEAAIVTFVVILSGVAWLSYREFKRSKKSKTASSSLQPQAQELNSADFCKPSYESLTLKNSSTC